MSDTGSSPRARLERLLLWRVWERLLEMEFLDRSIALAGKAFVSFFPLVIVVAAFVPEGLRESIITTLADRLGLADESLTTTQEAFASSDDIREATGVLGLVLTIFFATSFMTALQRVYRRAWRRPAAPRGGAYWRGFVWLAAQLGCMALLGAIRGVLHGETGALVFVLIATTVTACLWWFSAWFFLLGEVRPRVLFATGVVTSILMAVFVVSAAVWMPQTVTRNEEQFGVFGIALALVTWFSGYSICILVGACVGPVLAEDPGTIGSFIRGGDLSVLTAGARAPFPSPARAHLRDAVQGRRTREPESHRSSKGTDR
jgi:membrane protein